ncbi:MAG: aldo/keto reductase [Armatimonadota bacterium]|nr:aldo/keto reductase [Armatimonadota bacterium]
MGRMSRRKWISSVAGMALASVAIGQTKTLPKRPLGRTGVQVPILGVGCGSAFMAMNDDEAEKYLHRALELGLTYWDTAYSYGGGNSETRLGRVLKTQRAKIFLATKTADRTYSGAMRQIELSLKRLQTDRIDLIQMHDWRPSDDSIAISKKDGVLTALRKLRDEKVVRFIGLTGHTTAEGMRKVLELYDDIDTVLMPVNPAQPEFEEQILPIAKRKGIAVLAMKVTGRWVLTNRTDVALLLRYSWSAPISVAVVGMTGLTILETNYRLATSFEPMDEAERKNLQQKLRAMRNHLPYLAANYRDGHMV